MFQVRIHGRGGQGVATAAEMPSVAAFLEGERVQVFPSFGSQRTGAPAVAFRRIADEEIRLREPIQQPDAAIVQDPTLFRSGRSTRSKASASAAGARADATIGAPIDIRNDRSDAMAPR